MINYFKIQIIRMNLFKFSSNLLTNRHMEYQKYIHQYSDGELPVPLIWNNSAKDHFIDFNLYKKIF